MQSRNSNVSCIISTELSKKNTDVSDLQNNFFEQTRGSYIFCLLNLKYIYLEISNVLGPVVQKV